MALSGQFWGFCELIVFCDELDWVPYPMRQSKR